MDYKLFVCVQCGFEYDEAKGWPEDGIAPGTRWARHPRGLELPGLRRSEIRLRDGRGRPAMSVTEVTPAQSGPAPARSYRVAAMNASRPGAARVPYAEASRVLLRDSILDGMREMLLERDWSAITLTDVARAAGISRQTIYNEFGSRQGLAQGYALRLADRWSTPSTRPSPTNVGQVVRGLPGGLPHLLRRVRLRPTGHLVAQRRGQTRSAADHHDRQRAHHQPLLAAVDHHRPEQLDQGHRRGRRRAGPRDRANWR
jgi:AcrR family transcriptional regulator/rubredoxin